MQATPLALFLLLGSEGLSKAPAPLPRPVRQVTAADLCLARVAYWRGQAWPVNFNRDGTFWCGNRAGADASHYWAGTWALNPGSTPGEAEVTLWERLYTPSELVPELPYRATLRLRWLKGQLIGAGWESAEVKLGR